VRFRWLICIVLLWVFAAEGRVQESCAYTRAQVFQSALRFIRVDNGFPLTEKDEASGYLLFEYPTGEGSETTLASFEVIEQASAVQFVVRIPKLAEHHERLLVRRFIDKLRSEYGDPPEQKPAPKKAPKKATPDEDDDHDDDNADDSAEPGKPDGGSHDERRPKSK
jgi:hypothetical protein